MSERRADRGIDITYTDGTVEHVECRTYWVGDGVLHTGQYVTNTHRYPYEFAERGPSFPFANLRKWEETR